MAQIVTITNPLTGQPAQVDQLDHTAQQIDDGLNIARGVSNPNLLDNWYFGNPVDQRGGYVVPPGVTVYESDFTTPAGTTDKYYTLVPPNSVSDGNYFFGFNGKTAFVKPENAVRGYTGVGYGPDRWSKTGEPVITLTENGLKLSSASQYQWLQTVLEQNLVGKQVTLSILYSDGVLQSGTNEVSETAKSFFYRNNWFARVYGVNGNTIVQFFNGGGGELEITAIKLELGTQQTLAHQENGVWQLNEIPDYGEQLARCQRYFCRMYCRCPPKNSTAAYDYQNGGFISFPVTMRTNPSGSLISKEVSTIRLGETTVNGFEVGGADNYSRPFVADFTADL